MSSTYCQTESTCYGSTTQGYISNSVKLPTSGKNFESYSTTGSLLGRTYVHSKVAAVIKLAYQILEVSEPNTKFIYGETGYKNGGKFRPHKSHQNGLSVDFFVPLNDVNGEAQKLPISIFNKFGYNIEFDSLGRFENFSINYIAMANHLKALKEACDKIGISIKIVIFDNRLQQELFKFKIAKELKLNINFSTKKPWVRHDEHYHVDFIIPCKSINEYK